MNELDRLTKMVDDMTMAAARAAISLLHSFGLSAKEAEDLVNAESPQVAPTRPWVKQRVFTVPPITKYSGDATIIKTITKPMAYQEPVELVGITPTPGRMVFPEAVFQFDRLIPLCAKIDTIETDGRTYYGVLAVEQVDDCTYRCTIDCYKENNDDSISIHVIR